MAARVASRRDEIVALTANHAELSVVELAQRFGVTESTIRRDLAHLDGDGRLARTYGGVIAHRDHREASLRQREREASSQKHRIAVEAAGFVSPGDSVFLDAGTSCAALARLLTGVESLTIATSGLSSLQVLAGSAADQEVLCLGGRLRPISQGLVGPLTEMVLEHLTFDLCFFGADAVTADRGLCEASLEQIRLKELIVRASDRVVVLAHSEKLGRRPFNVWFWPRGEWTLITDSGIPAEQRTLFERRGVELVVVDGG